MLAREQSRLIESAIEALPTEYAAVFEMRHFQDASYEEMAEVPAAVRRAFSSASVHTNS